MRPCFTVALALGLGVPATATQAQALPAIPDSARIRVWAPTLDLKKESAVFLAWDSASVRVAASDRPEVVSLPFESVTRMEVQDGKDHLKGVLVGGSAGGLLGGLLGLAIGRSATDGCREFLCELDTLKPMTQGMLIGFGVGGLIGAVAPPDRWVRQRLPAEAGFPQSGPDLWWLYSALASVAVIALAR